MNENSFISKRTHTRVKFEALTVSCQLACLTPQSPAAQTIDTTGGSASYVPNRALTPTAIFPYVRAMDPDNVFHHGPANEFLGTIEWFVNGEPIADVWTLNTDYNIDTSSTDVRGTLYVRKNLGVGEDVVLTFKGQFLDWRTGIVYNVESDELALTTVNKGEDKYACCVDKPLITYDPLYDNLLLYDYMVGMGIPVVGNRASHIDEHAFEQTVKVLLTHGANEITTLPQDITMRVVRMGTSTALTPNSVSAPELLQASYPNVKFDMRLISKAEYEVQFIKSNEVFAKASIGLNTEVTMPMSGCGQRSSDIAASQVVNENSVLINLRDRLVEYPELYYLIRWFTQAKYYDDNQWKFDTAKEWQRGEHMLAEVSELGIGLTKNDSYFDYWFQVDPHATLQLLTADNDDVLTDDNGNFLIG